MKNLLITAFIFLIAIQHSTAQSTEELFSLPELYYVFQISNHDIIQYQVYFYYGDTVMCGENYFMFSNDRQNPNRFIKVDGEKVLSGHHCDTMKIVMDFSLSISDTIHVENEPFQVIEKDTIQLLDGLARTHVELVSLVNDQRHVDWIDGLGSVKRGIIDVGDPGLSGQRLVCVGFDENHTYVDPSWTEDRCLQFSCRRPEVNFDVESDDNGTITINNNTLFADSFYWDFGDGHYSTDENPSHTYNERGCYIITVNAVSQCKSITSRNQLFDYCMDSLWMSISSNDSVDRGFISFPTNEIGYVIHKNNLFKTTNGGMDWSQVNLPSSQPDPPSLTWLKAINPDTVYLTKAINTADPAYSILVSYDGGDTWQQKVEEYFAQVIDATVDGKCAVSTLAENNLYISTDFGKTWIKKPTPGTIDWHNLQWLEGGTLIAMGITFILPWGDNIIAFSEDQGDTWDIADRPEYNRSMHFIDRLTGWVGGNDKIYKTINGGLNWVPTTLPGISFIDDIDFIDENRGWAVGNKVYGTEDGGETWYLEKCVPQANVTNLDISAEGTPFYSTIFTGLHRFEDLGESTCLSATTNAAITPLEISIFPNPVSDVLFIEQQNQHSKIAQVKIWNTQGKLMHRQIQVSTSASINVRDYPLGTYIVEVISKGGESRETFKMVKV